MVVMAWAFVRMSLAALPERRRSGKALVWLTLLLTGKFLVRELALGQFNLPLALLLLSAVIAAQHGRRSSAGAFVAAGVFVKPYALVLVPWLAWTLGWRPFVAFGLVLAAGLLLPAATYGWHGNLTLLHEWYRTVTETTAPNLMTPENISFASMWAKWIRPGPAAEGLALASAVAAVAAGLFVMSRRQHVAEPNYLEGAYFFDVGAPVVAARLGLRARARAAGLHVPRGSVARHVARLAHGGPGGLLSHELHDLRPAAAAPLRAPHAPGRRQRRCRARGCLRGPPAVAGGRLSGGRQILYARTYIYGASAVDRANQRDLRQVVVVWRVPRERPARIRRIRGASRHRAVVEDPRRYRHSSAAAPVALTRSQRFMAPAQPAGSAPTDARRRGGSCSSPARTAAACRCLRRCSGCDRTGGSCCWTPPAAARDPS